MRRAFFSLALSVLAAAPAAADVLGVRAAAQPDGASLSIDLSEASSYRVFALENPARVVIDLPKTRWRAGELSHNGDTGVASLRHGLFRPDVYRLVFDLRGIAAVKDATLVPDAKSAGQRLIVSLAYGKTPARGPLGELVPDTRHKPEPAPTPPRRAKARVIVIDAGHGGVDPGAIGAGGVVEKRVNLAVAKALKRHIQARPGYEVVLTRNRDVFLQLRERIRLGRAANADLFISIHADSHPSADVSGASIYTLSETASDKEAARLAQSENRADLIGGVALVEEQPEVFGILLDLTQRETKNQSSAAADDLLFALAANQPLLQGPKRAAGFAVLKAPDVPSVLIELGFLSNRQDAARLNSDAGRDQIARSIAEGVFRYFDGANTARALAGN